MAKKIFIGFVALVLVAFVLLFQFGGRAAEELTKKLLAEQTALQGTLKAEEIQANWSGDVIFKNVVWVGPDGKTIAEIPLATVSVNLFDALLKGGTGASVGDVVIDKPSFFVSYNKKDGLNIVNYINFQVEEEQKNNELLTVKKAAAATQFRGLMEIKDAKVNLLLENKPLDFDKVQFQGNFKQYPKIKYGLRVKDGKSDIIADIQNDSGTTAVVAEVKKMPLQNILNVLPQAADVVITEGNLPDVKIRADKADDKWTLNIDGTIDGLKGSLINYPVTKGSGRFSADTEALKFAGLNLEVAGQTVIIDGNVYYAEKPEAKQTYALTVNAPSFVIEAMSSGLGLKDAVTALGKVKGTIDKPEAEGTFGLDKLAYDPLYITALSGKFLYKDGKLNIGDAIGNVYAGQVNVNGQIDTKTKDFKLEVQGIDLDSSVVTETQVDGPLSFKMLAIGTADAGSATGAGSFRIEEGKYMMLPFRSIKGSITRQQGKFAFSNIKIATAVGSFDTNIIVKDNGKLGFDLDKGFLAAQLGEK